MSSQRYIHINGISTSNLASTAKEKVMSYEEKTVGSTPFFKCEACPYMALAEDDIKFHLFTEHPNLAKSNGLADNIQIQCPGCTSIFDAEETLRTHLRNHHKMGIKDVRKMVKSLVQIALKNAKLKKTEPPTPVPVSQDIADMKIPQVIEIAPDSVNADNKSLPKGVAFISVDELHRMSTPNFEKIDPKEIIQEASINIVYANEVSTQYVNVSNTSSSHTNCSMIQVSSVPPDLISSIQPRAGTAVEPTQPAQNIEKVVDPPISIPQKGRPKGSNAFSYEEKNVVEVGEKKVDLELGTSCSVDNCVLKLKDEAKLAYHRKCHQNGTLHCQECTKIFSSVDALHTHLWKEHEVDMELPTCGLCGYKTFKKYRLYNIHMKCHGKIKSYICDICSKAFKTVTQLSKHRLIHKKEAIPLLCSICQLPMSSKSRLKDHMAAVHEKIRPFKCSHCNYSAARKVELKLHLRSHTGDKPYACDQCIYRTSDHNSLRRHKKSHANEAMYSCKYCSFTSIQSTQFASHMISKHPNVTSDIFRCPYCKYKSVSKDKYVMHLTSHPDKEGIQLLIEMNSTKSKPSWTIPLETAENHSSNDIVESEPNEVTISSTDNTIDVDSYDCDSLSGGIPQDYINNYPPAPNIPQPVVYSNQVHVQDLSIDHNNAGCLMSESSTDTLIERHQYPAQLGIQNLHGYLSPAVSMEQNIIQSDSRNALVTSHSAVNNSIIGNNIMSNFPIRLPHAPQLSVRNNITLTPVDKITAKVTLPILKPTHNLPVVLSCSSSPVGMAHDLEGVPRKKPKISVKSNLILKGPDQENMFHSQQKMAFKRLEDNERFGLGPPVSFNNLSQFMQLRPAPALALGEPPASILPFAPAAAAPPPDPGIADDSQIFTFKQQMNASQMTLLPPPQKIQTNDPSYIKLEATIKQNTQSPSLERMCNANLLSNPAISREYKASPPLEDIHKNLSEIKNELKSDAYYNMNLNNNPENPPNLDQYLIDNLIGEQYSGISILDLPAVVMPEVPDDQQNDVIEIDDNSDDNKLLPRFEMNFPLESLYLMHDFHFLENEVPANSMASDAPVGDLNRMVAEAPLISQKENFDAVCSETPNIDYQNPNDGKKDPMMNTPTRLNTNKINVKNIELMKN